MDKKFTYKNDVGTATFNRGAFPEYTDEHLHRLETENKPVLAVLEALNEFEKKERPRPILVSAPNRSCGECPNCGSFVADMDGKHYCSSCGQSLSGSIFKKTYALDITSGCIRATNIITGERKDIRIHTIPAEPAMKRAAGQILEDIINDFLVDKEKFDNSKTTADAAESGSEDDGK